MVHMPRTKHEDDGMKDGKWNVRGKAGHVIDRQYTE